MVNFKEDEQLSTLNHSCAHLMAQAIKHLFPQAKFWVGPVVAEGFYYDVDLGDDVIRDEDITAIEKEMKKIAKSGKKIIRKEISKEEAMEITPEQFQMLMQGLSIVAKYPIKELKDPPKTMQYCAIRRKNILFKKIVIHNQNLMETILVIKDTFDASCQREKVSTVI